MTTKEFNPADWASLQALDIISIVLGNPYKTSLEIVRAFLLEVEARGALRGGLEVQEHIHQTIDRVIASACDERQRRPVAPSGSDTGETRQ